MTEPLGVSVEEAKRHLGDISTATVYRLAAKKTLDLRKVGSRTIITMASSRSCLGLAQQEAA